MPGVTILDVSCNWDHKRSTTGQSHSMKKIDVKRASDKGRRGRRRNYSPSLDYKQRDVASLSCSQQQLSLL